jgi:branched-chain amino acid transport system ATP-binding protein
VGGGRGSNQSETAPILQVERLRIAHGSVVVVRDLDFVIERGASLAILGANGAGKTSTVEALAGLIPKQGGRVRFNAQNVTRATASEMARRGLALVPQTRDLFPTFNVEETLLAGASAARDREAGRLVDIYNLFPRLSERRRQLAGTLSGGEQQMLAIGRAMMSRPKLLMLDEPSMGLSPLMMQRIMSTIVELQSEGVTILLVEQNAPAALSLANYGYVLEVGKIVLENTGEALLGDENVRKAYLGED